MNISVIFDFNSFPSSYSEQIVAALPIKDVKALALTNKELNRLIERVEMGIIYLRNSGFLEFAPPAMNFNDIKWLSSPSDPLAVEYLVVDTSLELTSANLITRRILELGFKALHTGKPLNFCAFGNGANVMELGKNYSMDKALDSVFNPLVDVENAWIKNGIMRSGNKLRTNILEKSGILIKITALFHNKLNPEFEFSKPTYAGVPMTVLSEKWDGNNFVAYVDKPREPLRKRGPADPNRDPHPKRQMIITH